VVSARAAERVRPEQLLSIAPAVNILGRELREIPGMPWLVIQGGADEIVAPAEVRDWAATLQPQPKLIVLPEAGHFFHGHLVDLRSILVKQLSDTVE
jgi:alpha/beta superfamily hydrolase